MKTPILLAGLNPYLLAKQMLTVSLVATLGALSATPNAWANDDLKDKAKSAWRNPIVKQAAVGAGVGAAAGALSRESSVLKGAGVGALTGAGTGLIDSSKALDNKPLVKSTAKGAVIGTGVGAVTDKSKVKGAAVGAGVGAGAHFLKKYWNND